MKLTRTQLEEMRRRAEAATYGKWVIVYHEGRGASLHYDYPGGSGGMPLGCREVDRAFIAASRPDVPLLIAKVLELDAVLAEIAKDAACQCAADYTRRGKHEPNALCYVADLARSARLGE